MEDIVITKTHALVKALNDKGVLAGYYFERNGIPCVMVFLDQTPGYKNIDTEPALFVMIEDTPNYRGFDASGDIWEWLGAIGNTENDTLEEIKFQFPEWRRFGDTEEQVADKVIELFKFIGKL